MSFLSVDACIKKLLEQAKTNKTAQESISLIESYNRILAEDVRSEIDVPPADNSAMDGYAVYHQDTPKESNIGIPISQTIHAGSMAQPLARNTAARIFTGAEIPQGADTVIIQEDCQAKDGIVYFQSTISQGANIRRQGQDIKAGSTILHMGQRLSAADVGLLASIGIAKVNAFKKLTVAIVNTGDELVEPGNPLQEGQIYNSNRFLLDSLLSAWGFDVKHTHILGDSLDETKQALNSLSEKVDLIISTGGVSVGDKDFIKPAVESLGTLELWKVAIKPGKPFAFGKINQTPFIGLPGNPASVFVTLIVLAKPFLLIKQGISHEELIKQTQHRYAVANFDKKAPKREEYIRGRTIMDANNLKKTLVEAHPNQSSGVLSSASWGNCLVKQEVGQAINVGDIVEVIFY